MRRWLACLILLGVAGLSQGSASQEAPLKQVQTIPLPGVQGRFDHFTVDLAGQRLFLVALGNNTLEVLDLKSNRVAQSLRGFRMP